jgi:hypothetical protein
VLVLANLAAIARQVNDKKTLTLTFCVSIFGGTDNGNEEMEMPALTEQHYIAMQAAEGGADIYSRPIAELLREVEKHNPDWIMITKPMAYDGDGTDQMPYFGAILTEDGVKAMEDELDRHEQARTTNHPPHVTQASKLLETGACDLPLDWSDLARRVAAHPHYADALKSSYKGNHRLLKLITENAAIALCKDFSK